jgi:hypothetical protein
MRMKHPPPPDPTRPPGPPLADDLASPGLPAMMAARPPRVGRYLGKVALRFAVFVVVMLALTAPFHVPNAWQAAAIAAIVAIPLGIRGWDVLADPARADADGTSRTPMAGVRRWLRRVLGIRVV